MATGKTHGNQNLPPETLLKIAEARAKVLKGVDVSWFVVWRHGWGWKAVAAFPKVEFAQDWIREAEHRKDDVIMKATERPKDKEI